MSDDGISNPEATSLSHQAAKDFRRAWGDLVEFLGFPYFDASVPLTTLLGAVLHGLFLVLALRQTFGGTDAFKSQPFPVETASLLALGGAVIYLVVYQCYRIPRWRAWLKRLTDVD